MKGICTATILALMLLVPPSSAKESTVPEVPVTIVLGSRQALATPWRQGFTHSGGGNIDVAQPSDDSMVVTMTAVAVAGGHPGKDSQAILRLDLEQCFEVTGDAKQCPRVALSLEGRVTGLLRSHRHGGGSAAITLAAASIACESGDIVQLSLPGHTVACGENLAVNDRQGPMRVEVGPGRYVLRQTFLVTAAHPNGVWPCKPASAEFAPDPALDPRWISANEPFHGANKQDFGFQVTLRAVKLP